MKAAVFYGKHDIKVEEVPMPQVGDRDVLIKVEACGICGTDVHIFEGDKGAAACTPPTILGHEFSGVVEATGRLVTKIKVGERVVWIRIITVETVCIAVMESHISAST